MNRQTVVAILAKGKALAPDRFPAIPANDEAAEATLEAWREALSIVALPPDVWSAAVTMWATSMVEDRMCTPRDLIRAAYAVRDRWEQRPDRRELLEQYRLARLNSNYQRMGLEQVDRAALDRGEGAVERPVGVDSGPVRLGEVVRLQRPQRKHD